MVLLSGADSLTGPHFIVWWIDDRPLLNVFEIQVVKWLHKTKEFSVKTQTTSRENGVSRATYYMKPKYGGHSFLNSFDGVVYLQTNCLLFPVLVCMFCMP